jgi:sulfur carrier protein
MELLLRINGAERRFAPPLTVAGLVGELGVEGKRIAIERNGEIVPRSRYGEVELADGDRLEVVVAVGGG